MCVCIHLCVYVHVLFCALNITRPAHITLTPRCISATGFRLTYSSGSMTMISTNPQRWAKPCSEEGAVKLPLCLSQVDTCVLWLRLLVSCSSFLYVPWPLCISIIHSCRLCHFSSDILLGVVESMAGSAQRTQWGDSQKKEADLQTLTRELKAILVDISEREWGKERRTFFLPAPSM